MTENKNKEVVHIGASSLQLYTQDKAAALLGLSTRTLEGWRFRGIGPDYSKIGGRVRYRHDKLEEWIDDQTRELEPLNGQGAQ